MDYRSQGDTRLTINGSRHYKTPYGSLPSVTTILSETSGSKAALERWAKKNPGGREAAAARGTKVHSLMEDYLLGVDKDPKIDDPALIYTLKKDIGYIGSLGSKKTHNKRCERLIDIGFCQSDLSKIHGPIGLNIKAKTPAEIAVSIMAEIINFRRSKNEKIQ